MTEDEIMRAFVLLGCAALVAMLSLIALTVFFEPLGG